MQFMNPKAMISVPQAIQPSISLDQAVSKSILEQVNSKIQIDQSKQYPTYITQSPEQQDDTAKNNNNTGVNGFKCPHVDRKHYAKNMCLNCYHKCGKSKMASKCIHTNKSHYSNGLCQNCYLAQYYRKRKEKQLSKQKVQSEVEDFNLEKELETAKRKEDKPILEQKVLGQRDENQSADPQKEIRELSVTKSIDSQSEELEMDQEANKIQKTNE